MAPLSSDNDAPTADEETGGRARGLNVVKRETLKERIYKEIRRALLAGKFEPGEAITVKLLEDELGAGTMPIRESLHRLVAEGALNTLPNGRVRVPQFTADEFDEIKEIRLRLEGLAAGRAATHRTADELDAIIASHDELAAVLAANARWPEVIECNRRFHFAIYEASHTSHLVSIIDSLWLRVSPLLALPFKMPTEARIHYVSIHARSHTDLMEAVRNGDSRSAEAAIREIILASAAWYHRHHQFADQAVPSVSWR